MAGIRSVRTAGRGNGFHDFLLVLIGDIEMSHSTELKFRLGLNELILVSGSASLAEYFGITEIAVYA